MLRLLKAKLAAILLIIITSAFVAHAQAAKNPRIYGEPDGLAGADCEGVMARLDIIAISADELGKDRTIIIIARLGSGESSRSLVASRLRQVADYLNRRVSGDRMIRLKVRGFAGLGNLSFRWREIAQCFQDSA